MAKVFAGELPVLESMEAHTHTHTHSQGCAMMYTTQWCTLVHTTPQVGESYQLAHPYTTDTTLIHSTPQVHNWVHTHTYITESRRSVTHQ